MGQFVEVRSNRHPTGARAEQKLVWTFARDEVSSGLTGIILDERHSRLFRVWQNVYERGDKNVWQSIMQL